MDWNEILNQAVYPAISGLILLAIAVGLRALATWLKAMTAKIQNDLLRSIVTDAVASVEQQAAVAEKNSQAKWSGATKKDTAAAVAAADAKSKGLSTTDAEIAALIESALGMKKL